MWWPLVRLWCVPRCCLSLGLTRCKKANKARQAIQFPALRHDDIREIINRAGQMRDAFLQKFSSVHDNLCVALAGPTGIRYRNGAKERRAQSHVRWKNPPPEG